MTDDFNIKQHFVRTLKWNGYALVAFLLFAGAMLGLHWIGWM